MKKIKFYSVFCVGLLFYSFGYSQILTVGSETDFNIKSGTIISLEKLELTPSENFTLNSVSFGSSSTSTNGNSIFSISKYFKFSATTAVFSGLLRLNYLNSEINDLNESGLKLVLYNGINWGLYSSSSNDNLANIVSTTLNNKALNELTLGICTPPEAPSAVGTAICSGNTADLTAIGIGDIRWYDAETSGNLIYSGSIFTTPILTNTTIYYAEDFTCDASATRTAVTVTVNENLSASVSIASNATDDTICAGTSVTFTASPTNGGTPPTYQWKIGMEDVGTDSNTFTSNELVNLDSITVVMTSNAACVSSSGVTSDPIVITVNSILSASVSIASNVTDDTICAGTSVTFTASPINEGDSPTYQWKINGNNIDGETEATYATSSIADGQIVSVIMTSSETSSCLNNSPALSNDIVTTVKSIVSIDRQPVATNICISSGAAVISVSAFGGSSAGLSYQWQVKTPVTDSEWVFISDDEVYNNSDTAILEISNPEGSLGMNGNLYKVIVTDLRVSPCVESVTSEEAVLTVNRLPISGYIYGKYGEICISTSKTLKNYGGSGSLQWEESLDNITYSPIVGANLFIYTSQFFVNKYIKAVRTSGACPSVTSEPFYVSLSNTSVAGTITGGNITVCSGETLVLTLNNSIGNLQWQRAIVLNGVIGTYTDHIYANNKTISHTFSASTTTHWSYRVKVTVGDCSSIVYTEPVTITILKSVAGTLSGAGTICSGDSKILTLGTHVGNVQWQSSTDRTIWEDIDQETENTYTASPTIITSFRVKVTSGSCSPAYSLPITVNVDLPVTSGTITEGNFTVCSGLPSAIHLQDNSNHTIAWYKSVNAEATWTRILNTTTATVITDGNTTLSTGNLSVSTWYKAILTNSTCTATTPTIKVTVTPIAKAGTITTSTTSVCSGDDITFSLNNNIGTIQWQSAPISTGIFTTIDGATQSNYTVLNATATSDKSYKAVVSSANGNGVCSTSSVVKTIIVNPQTVVGSIIGGGTICSGLSGILKITGFSGAVQWQSSIDGIIYVNVPSGLATAGNNYSSGSVNGRSVTFLATNITANTYFRAKVSSGICSVMYTNAVLYTLGTSATAGTLTAADQTVCKGAGSTLTLTGSIGTIKWWRSTDWTATSPTWTALPSTMATIATGNLSVSTAYKSEVSIGGTCSTQTSQVLPVMVFAAPLAKTITTNLTSPTGATSALAICNTSTSKVLTIGAGSVGAIQWQRSSTSSTSGFTDIADATATSYTITNPTVGANYFRAKFTNSCGVSVFGTAFRVYYKDCTLTKGITSSEFAKTTFSVISHPNPFSRNFNLEVSSSSSEKVEVLVYDMIGRLLEKHQVIVSEIRNLEIGTNYPIGVFNVIVMQGTEVKTVRVIKK